MFTINDILGKIGFGDFNPLKDTNTLYTDQRRGTPISTMNGVLRKYYDKNCLTNRNEFYGIVIDLIERTQPSHCNKNTWTQAGLGAEGTTNLYTVYNVYIPELECRPEPLSYNDPVIATYKEICVSNDLAMTVAKGSIVKVAYGDPLNFAQPEIVAVEGGIDASAIPAFREGLSSTYTAASTTNLVGEGCTSAAISGKRLSLTFQEVKTLRPSLQGLMEYIAGHESRGNYNAVNRGVGGDTPGGSAALPGVGKNLTDMTIIELQSYMRNGSKAQQTGKGGNNRYGFLATGKYQLIPSTLKIALQYFPEINRSTVKYDIETQEVLGLSLALMKQPKLGRYLLGVDSDECAAGQEAALEWASLPVQTARPNGCQRGFSAYCVGGANSTRRLSRTPEEVIAQLQEARAVVQASPAAMEIIRRKYPA
jgi:hypothetical protein